MYYLDRDKITKFVENKIEIIVAFLNNTVNSPVAHVYEFVGVFFYVQLSKPTQDLLFICSAGR